MKFQNETSFCWLNDFIHCEIWAKNSNFTKCNAIFKKKFTEIEFLFSNIKIHPISWALNQSQFKHHSLLFFSHSSDFSELFFFLKNGIRFFYSQNHSRMFLLSCEFSFFCSLLIMRQCEFFHISLLASDKKLSFKLFWMSQMDSHFHFHLLLKFINRLHANVSKIDEQLTIGKKFTWKKVSTRPIFMLKD